MRDIMPQAHFALTFDYHSRIVNIFVTFLGFFFNIFHFSILVRKSLRSSPVFIMMMVICICDLFQLIGAMANDVKYLLEFNKREFCLGFDTYNGVIFMTIIGFISEFSMFISKWLTVLMAFFRSLSIKFSMSRWSAQLSRPRTARYTAQVVIFFSLFYNFSCFWFKYEVTPKDSRYYCHFSTYKGPANLYSQYSENHYNAILLFTLLDGVIQLVQLIFFTFSSVFLAKFIRETLKVKLFKNKEDRRNEKTEGLILFTLCSFFVCTFPILVVNFLLPLYYNLDVAVYKLMMTATIITMLQTLNASTHGIICLLMSSQYRDVAKTAFSSRSRSSSSSVVAPAGAP